MDAERLIEAPPSSTRGDRVVVAPPSQIFRPSQEDRNGDETIQLGASGATIPVTEEQIDATTRRRHRATKPTPTHVLIASRVRLLTRTPDGKSLVQYEDGTTDLITAPIVPLDVVKAYL